MEQDSTSHQLSTTSKDEARCSQEAKATQQGITREEKQYESSGQVIAQSPDHDKIEPGNPEASENSMLPSQVFTEPAEQSSKTEHTHELETWESTDILKVVEKTLVRFRDLGPASKGPTSLSRSKPLEPAYSQLHEISTLVAYVEHLEKTVAHLKEQASPQIVAGPTKAKDDQLIDSTTDQRLDNDGRPEEEKLEGKKVVLSKQEVENKKDDKNPEHKHTSWKVGIKTEIKLKPSNSFERTQFFPDSEGYPLKESNIDENGHIMARRRVFNDKKVHIRTVLKIYSPLLKEALKDNLAISRSPLYRRFSDRLTSIHEPYMLLFQNRKKLVEAANKAEGEKREHLKCLLDFLKTERPTTWETLNQLEKGTCERISFQDIWLLYPSSTTVYRKYDGHWRAYKAENVHVRYLPQWDTLYIGSYSLDFNDKGTMLTPKPERLQVLPFVGDRSIIDLEVIPQSHFNNIGRSSEDIKARGQKFWGFHGEPAYRQYVGSAWPSSLPSDQVKVVIDYVTASKYVAGGTDHFSHRLPYPLSQFDEFGDRGKREEPLCNCAICARKYAELGSYPEHRLDATEVCPKDRWSREQQTQEMDLVHLQPDDAFLFCPSHVQAFSLKHKTWEMVEIDKLSPVEEDPNPFKRLVMDDKYKNVVESMVDSYLGNDQFADIIKEKGRGLIVLLHGGPGTGKTLTAECVAEKKRRPLYMVTCGDLGTEPDVLEKRLQKTFLYAVNWKAILLLDEADVFLQERGLHDLKRNALVSIFLRHLEYYDGLLFLTTNRPGQIDEAFQSRIHITLGLPDLSAKAQSDVWAIFIRKLKLDGDKDINKGKKRSLFEFINESLHGESTKADYQMNGRQIRNCIRAATALAIKNNRVLQNEDIVEVIDLGKKFKNYMAEVNRMTPSDRAMALGYRWTQSST